MTVLDQLVSVLCDQDGKCCIRGSEADRQIVDEALTTLRAGLDHIAAQDAEIARLRESLKFYADKEHFDILDDEVWDTVSGEPQNFWYDEASTAVIEDGAIARAVLTTKGTT